jgi:homoserine kinase
VAGSRFPRVTNLIHAVFRLDDGQIVVDAAVDERHPDQVRAAVTGGTGAYEGARGTFTTRPGKAGNTDQVVLLPL